MNSIDFLSISAAVFAILMCGSGQPKNNIILYAIQTFLIAMTSISHSFAMETINAYLIAVLIIASKTVAIPSFLFWLIKKIDAQSDSGSFISIPISMHTAILLLGLSHFLASNLHCHSVNAATACISLLLTGILFMLTRRIALSLIIGFLTMENGIFLFAVAETRGMPLIVEMGVVFDVLVAVMMAGLFIFRIKKSFEHIDVTQLNRLKDS